VYRFRLTIDGRSAYSRASEIFLANSGLLLGLKNLQLDEKASLDSGKLSICTAQLRTLLDYVRIAVKLFVQSSEDIEDFNCVQAAREVVIEANRPVTVQGDGELIGNTPVTVKLIPRALHVVCPLVRE
jgi:diacylglycerol kinase family enzyme